LSFSTWVCLARLITAQHSTTQHNTAQQMGDLIRFHPRGYFHTCILVTDLTE
jgi:hypothetical protein